MKTLPLIDRIHFKNYRNFIDFEMKNLSHINLIVGNSNVGKTGLLEGLVALWGDDNKFNKLPSTFRMSVEKGTEKENYWKWFFPEKELDAKPVFESYENMHQQDDDNFFTVSYEYRVELKSNNYRNIEQKIRDNTGGVSIRQVVEPSYEFILLPVGMGNYLQQVDQFNEIAQKNNGKENLIKSLQIIEPRLKGLDYLKLPNSSQAMIYADIGLDYKIPTTQFGHGFTRSMEMLTQLILSDAQIMIADEIENGIHYGSLESVWKAIISYAMQNDIQVFATTHSRECISAAHQAMLEQDDYSLNVIRLQNEDDQVVAINNSQEDIEAVLSMGMPLR